MLTTIIFPDKNVMILFILFKNEWSICPIKMCHSKIMTETMKWKHLDEHKPNKVGQENGNFSPQSCKCWPTSHAALPPDLFRASVCSLCIYRLFSSCPQTALQICRNSKLVLRFQRRPWCITFSSVNLLTFAAILIWQEYWWHPFD